MKRTPLAALALLVVVACAGCSDDPEPDFAPPDSTSPTPTDPTTTATTPEKLSPEETVRAWVEARDTLMLTGDASDVDALSASSCTTCADQIDPLKAVLRAGGRFETKGWRVVRTSLDSESAKGARVTAGLAMSGGTTYPSADASPVQYGPEKRIAEFRLEWINEAWSIRMIGFLQ